MDCLLEEDKMVAANVQFQADGLKHMGEKTPTIQKKPPNISHFSSIFLSILIWFFFHKYAKINTEELSVIFFSLTLHQQASVFI